MSNIDGDFSGTEAKMQSSYLDLMVEHVSIWEVKREEGTERAWQAAFNATMLRTRWGMRELGVDRKRFTGRIPGRNIFVEQCCSTPNGAIKRYMDSPRILGNKLSHCGMVFSVCSIPKRSGAP